MEHLSDDVGELVEFWTLLDEDRVLLEGRRGATALGFALLLKHYSRHGRFPRGRGELPAVVLTCRIGAEQNPAAHRLLRGYGGQPPGGEPRSAGHSSATSSFLALVVPRRQD